MGREPALTAVDVAERAGQPVPEQLRGGQQRREPVHQRPEGPGEDPGRSPDRAGTRYILNSLNV